MFPKAKFPFPDVCPIATVTQTVIFCKTVTQTVIFCKTVTQLGRVAAPECEASSKFRRLAGLAPRNLIAHALDPQTGLKQPRGAMIHVTGETVHLENQIV